MELFFAKKNRGNGPNVATIFDWGNELPLTLRTLPYSLRVLSYKMSFPLENH